MPIYRVLQIRPCHKGDWVSHLFQTRTPPGPWHRIDGTVPDATHLLRFLKEAILTDPDLIGEHLVFSNGTMAAMEEGKSQARPGQEMTQMEMF